MKVKNLKLFASILVSVVFLPGCSLFLNDSDFISELKIENIQEKLHLGMNYQQLVDLAQVKPKMMNNGAAKFSFKNGELWVRFSGDNENPGEITFWGTITRMPDGTSIKKTSNQQTLKKMQNNPICIDIDIKTDFKNQQRVGKCYYEQYGPGNIKVDASEVGGQNKQVSVIFIKGRYVLFKGDVPKGAEFKYLAGYMANLQLVQSLISKGMKEATPIENGRRNFFFKSDGKPFIVEVLNKKIVYPEPWDVRGFVKPIQGQKGFDFDINFKVTWDKEKIESLQDTVFKGSFRQQQKTIGDNISLNEWKQYSLDTSGVLKLLAQPKKSFADFK